MMRSRLLLVALALLMASPAARGDRLRNVSVGEKIPEFSVTTVTGETLQSKDLAGKVLVLVFLSAEQRSSETAATVASALAARLAHPELAVVFMTADVTRVDFFRKQRDHLGIHEPLGLDVGRQVYGQLGLLVLPTTIIVDRERRLAHVMASVKSDHAHVLDVHVRHALGLIDDERREQLLERKDFERNHDTARISRRRAAARHLRKSGLLKDAGTELDAALEIDPEQGAGVLDLASLRIAQKRYDDAADLAERVLAATPQHRRGTLVAGAAAYHRGRLDEAEKLLRTALLLNPDPVWTHYYLGLTAERKGDAKAAVEHFREALGRVLEQHPM
ncbi:MAG: tetratricopeptide repeat protein [Planctomycetota bacterium]|jgi:tetratricopeptide (TPR) repeat protein